jgi:hypothetical protein
MAGLQRLLHEDVEHGHDLLQDGLLEPHDLEFLVGLLLAGHHEGLNNQLGFFYALPVPLDGVVQGGAPYHVQTPGDDEEIHQVLESRVLRHHPPDIISGVLQISFSELGGPL